MVTKGDTYLKKNLQLEAAGLLKYVWPFVTTVTKMDKNKSNNNSNKIIPTWKSILYH